MSTAATGCGKEQRCWQVALGKGQRGAPTKVYATKPCKSALHKGIALGFLKAIGFCNESKRTIFAVWCSDPMLPVPDCGDPLPTRYGKISNRLRAIPNFNPEQSKISALANRDAEGSISLRSGQVHSPGIVDCRQPSDTRFSGLLINL